MVSQSLEIVQSLDHSSRRFMITGQLQNRLVIACTFMFLCSGNASSEEERTQIFDYPLFGVRGVEISTFELSNVSPGMRKKATVFLQNKCDQSVEFLEVTASCKCTDAAVPKKVLEPNETAQLDFIFSVHSTLQNLKDSFDVTIKARGARESIRMRFNVIYENAATFGRPELVHSFDASSTDVSLAIPFQVSDGEFLKDINLETSEGLTFMTCKLASDKPVVECKFFTQSIDGECATGELRLIRQKKIVASTLLTLQKQKPVEIVPATILFSPNESNPLERNATAIVRVRPHEKVGFRSIRQIHVVGAENSKVEASYTIITDQMYRLKLKIEDGQVFDDSKGLSFVIETSDGGRFEFAQACVFSN